MDTLEESESGDGGADRAAAVRIAESIRMMKRLRRLAIQPYLYSFRDATVSLEAASALAQLQSLQLDDVTFAAGALRSCFGAARGLKILHIEGRVTVDDPAIFEAMADSLPRCLESLTVHARGGAEEEDDDSYEEELSTAMLDWHLMRIVDVVDDLQELDLEHCGQLTDASVAPALAKFGSLRALSLKWCAGVTDASLSELRSSALHELGLDCAAVTDRSIVPVLQKNTGLRRLGLRKTNVSDAIGPHLSALRTSLRDLSVSRTAITWPALRPFVLSKPPKLEQLAISYVAGVDDDAVRCIRDNLDGLQSLRMGECAGITRPEVLLYTTFKLQGTLETICLEGVPIADQDLVAAMDRIAGDSLFFSSRD
ncbi:hypothetical protein DFJ74DRAFT_646386 [Hyaloraphidium curvatum]|nr:hypothetical protein DFJ74DRAFT_646386 [Hyaloraphidium curvatum]